MHAGSEEQAQAIDDMLWTFSQGSFIPHARTPGEAQTETPVHIGHDRQPGFDSDVLINLSDNVPDFFRRFERIVEIVDQSDDAKVKARDRYRFYRDQQCEVSSHNTGR